MKTLFQIIQENNFDSVWVWFIKHYDVKNDKTISDYQYLYETLRCLSPSENQTNMIIYIKVLKEDKNGELYFPSSFEENDSGLFFDVCGKDDNFDCYSIISSSLQDWLSYFIDEKTLQQLSPSHIIAHCLWEMDFYGEDKVYCL